MDSTSDRFEQSSVHSLISSYEATISSYDTATLGSRSTTTPTPKNNPRTPSEISYRAVLGHLARHGVPAIAANDIQRSSNNAYGAGATLIVYPGIWHDSSRATNPPKVVALKYMHNLTGPQGVSRVQACVDEMNGRFKSICQELDAMVGKEGKFYNNFPRLFGVSWEEVLSPAGVYLHRPIMVVEAAMSNLETYVRQGSLTGGRRHGDQLRFVTSVYEAMNFLHQECDLLHGDLKPANILVFPNRQTGLPELKLADFGLAYDITERLVPADGRMQGTPYWSAPETYPNSPSWAVGLHSATQDYYSFGLVVWFILFGYPLGDLKNGYSKEDEKVFQRIKQQGMLVRPDNSSPTERRLVFHEGSDIGILDMLKQIYESRWKWEVMDPNAIEQLKAVEDIDGESSDSDDDGKDADEVRGELLQKLMAEGKVRELECNSDTSMWVQAEDPFHHIFRALMETALQQKPDDRRTVLHKPSQELLTRDVTYRLAALSLIGHSDPKSEVFSAWGMKYNPTSLQGLHRQEVQQWSKKQKQTESGEQDLLPHLTEEVVKSLPLKMAETMLTQMILEAGMKAKTGLHRQTLIASILAFRERLPDAADYRSWWKEYANSSPASERVGYVIARMLDNDAFDEDEAHTWALEGITRFPETDIGDQLLDMFQGIDHSLLRVPVRCAIWDYVTEFGINIPEGPDSSQRTDVPIFQSIIDGDFQAFRTLALEYGDSLPTLIFDDCNLLHFAIIHRKLEIMRYLVVEENFVIGEGEGYNEAIRSLLCDPAADKILSEMNRCHHLAGKKLFTRRQMSYRSLDPVTNLFHCETVAMVAGMGSQSFMHVLDAEYRDGLRPTSSMMLIFSLKESEGGESDGSSNPLYAALESRRLPAFMKMLQWGSSSMGPRTFSPNAIVDGFPLLFHAITSMAPFFVAALLANDADVNQFGVNEAGYETSPLYLACGSQLRPYRESLSRRRMTHEMMGFPESVIKQDELAMETSGSDIEPLRKLIITLLLRNGADINRGTQSPPDPITGARIVATPLVMCIKRKDSDLALLLIENGAEINPPDSTLTPLQHAINENLPTVVHTLLERGASPDGAVPLTLGPPLVNAELCNRPEMFKLLVDSRATLAIPPPGYDGDLLLHALLESTSEFFVRNLQPSELQRAMQIASVNSLEAFIQARRHLRDILFAHLQAMPVYELRRLMNLPTQEGAIAIHFAAEYIHGSEESDLELMELILENTVDLQARGPGYSALERATVLGNGSFFNTFLVHNMRRTLNLG